MIQDISSAMSTYIDIPDESISRGKQLEDILTNVCNELGKAGTLTEDKADIEFLLGIVASYLLAKHNDKIEEGALLPAELFDTRVFPQIDNFQEVEVEEIEDGDSTTDEVVGRETSTEDSNN